MRPVVFAALQRLRKSNKLKPLSLSDHLVWHHADDLASELLRAAEQTGTKVKDAREGMRRLSTRLQNGADAITSLLVIAQEARTFQHMISEQHRRKVPHHLSAAGWEALADATVSLDRSVQIERLLEARAKLKGAARLLRLDAARRGRSKGKGGAALAIALAKVYTTFAERPPTIVNRTDVREGHFIDFCADVLKTARLDRLGAEKLDRRGVANLARLAVELRPRNATR